MRRKVHWSYMRNYLYTAVEDFGKCVCSRGERHECHTKTYPGQRRARVHGNGHTWLIAKHNPGEPICSRRDLPLLLANKGSVNFEEKRSACRFHLLRSLDYVIQDAGIPASNKWHKIPEQNLQTHWNFLGLKHFTTRAYHSRTNGHGEWNYSMVIARIRQFVDEVQRRRAIFVQLIKYTYKSLTSLFNGWTLFSLVLSKHRFCQTIFNYPSILQTDAKHMSKSSILKRKLLPHTALTQERTNKN